MTEVNRRHIVTADQRAFCRIEILRIGRDKYDRTKTDNKRQDIEVTDKTSCKKDRFTRLFGICNGKETHQNMRQTCRTEHECDTK